MKKPNKAFGGPGRDTEYGSTSNDMVDDKSGDDSVSGGSGADWVKGGSGNDVLIYNVGVNTADEGLYDGGAGVTRWPLTLSRCFSCS